MAHSFIPVGKFTSNSSHVRCTSCNSLFTLTSLMRHQSIAFELGHHPTEREMKDWGMRQDEQGLWLKGRKKEYGKQLDRLIANRKAMQ